MPYAELPAFIATLRDVEGVAARALELTILTAVRTGDICGDNREDRPPMRWEHVDLDAAVWTIPATKTNVSLRVPLSRRRSPFSAGMQQLREGRRFSPAPGQAPRCRTPQCGHC